MTASLRSARLRGTCLLLALLLLPSLAAAGEEFAVAEVVEPYIELHTGPGVGYPVFHVTERGGRLQVLKRRTDWFKVRSPDGRVGWVSRAALGKTVDAEGRPLQVHEAGLGDFSQRRWEMGLLGGAFNDAPAISLYAGYTFTPQMSIEVDGTQVLGDYSSSYLANISLLSQPFARWRVSPFFNLGGGYLATRPRTTLVPPKDRDDFTAHVGLGLRGWLSRRFILRAEFRQYVAFASDDDNKEYTEWKAGFAFFF